VHTVLLVTRHTDLPHLGVALERAGFSVPVVPPERLASGLDAPRGDIVVLDLRDIPAAVLSLITSNYGAESPVLLAATGDDHVDRITADLAVDDFIVLPATSAELARRIERALWRRHGIDNENFVRCGALTIDLLNYRVTVDDEPLVLTFKEYELLRFLAMNAGRVFTREQLLNRVWGYDYFGGARTVDVHIRRIRSKVEIRGHAFIETVRNVGYRLVAEARKDEIE
jgi:DNA-binding response OmpR family regulator